MGGGGYYNISNTMVLFFALNLLFCYHTIYIIFGKRTSTKLEFIHAFGNITQ